MKKDMKTANAFANSWNNLPGGSVYTWKQFEDWFNPLTKVNVEGKSVLELGCGNASLLVHIANWNPSYIEGIDLGASVIAAEKNMAETGFKNYKITKADLTQYKNKSFDLVFSIGVLHHLKKPEEGFKAVIKNTKSGGHFHCWVYAYEGNGVIRLIVEPLRRIFSKFPWWFTKYFVATPAVIPFFLYAKFLKNFSKIKFFKRLPLYEYSLWISQREFAFFRHVVFDQLLAPQTTFIDKITIKSWLNNYDNIQKDSQYIIMRNGNSWKFGGQII